MRRARLNGKPSSFAVLPPPPPPPPQKIKICKPMIMYVVHVYADIFLNLFFAVNYVFCRELFEHLSL